MKDYEVNYVHQDSKTVPDVNYAFETSMKTFPDISSRTHKSVLLERWAKDTEAMANATIDIYCNDEDGWFEFPDGFSTGDSDTAFSHYIAYLNSAAEVGK